MKYWKGIALSTLIGGIAVIGFSTDAFSQAVPDQPIRGTIQVQEGADYQALARITPEQARAVALAEAPGATVQETELDEEDGYLVYEVEMIEGNQEVEVTVDAGDGSVLEVEREDAD